MEKMDQHKKQIIQDDHHHISWGFTTSSDQESIREETSTISNESSSVSSCSSFDTEDDDASTLTSSSSLLNSSGYSVLDLSDLMIQLPIKRGLSKFYQGKSESFTSLSRVMGIEDLPKKINNPYNKMRRIEGNSKSYGDGLDNYKSHTLPKPLISKKVKPF